MRALTLLLAVVLLTLLPMVATATVAVGVTQGGNGNNQAVGNGNNQIIQGSGGTAHQSSETWTRARYVPETAEEVTPTAPEPTEPITPTEPVAPTEPVMVGKKGFPWLAIGLVFLIALLGSGIMMYFCCWNKRDEEEEDEEEEKKNLPAEPDPDPEPGFEVIDVEYTIASSSNSAKVPQTAVSGRHQEALPKGKDPGPTVTPRYWG